MKIRPTLAGAIMMCFPANAQINSLDAEGCFQRADLMLQLPVFVGVDNQIDIMGRLNPAADLKERAVWLRAVAAYKSQAENAEWLIDRYLYLYPHSVVRQRALLLRASIPFAQGHYPLALQRLEEVDPDALEPGEAATLIFRTAFCHMKLGQYNQADQAFKQLSSAPEYANAAIFYQGYIAYAKGEYADALGLLKQVDTRTAPGDLADYYLAQIYYMQGNYNKALSTARAVMDRHGIDPEFVAEAIRIAGESYYNLGEESQAIPLLHRYVAMVPNPLPSTLYMLGVAQYRTGQYDDAIRQLGPVATETNAIGQSACLYIGQAYIHQGNNASALMALERACSMDFDPQVTETAYYNYAVARMRGGKIPFGSSVATFEEFLKRYPGSRYAPQVEEFIITGYMTDNDYARALRSIDAIKRPSAKVLAAKQRVLFVLGTQSLAAGNPKQALDYIDKSLELSQYNSEVALEARLWQADCCYRLGKYADAGNAYRDYLSRAPRNSVNRSLATYDLAYSLFAQKKYAASRTYFTKVTDQSAGLKTDMRADAYNRIADTYYYASDFNRARENYDRAYGLSPSTGDYAMYQKAMMRGLMRDYTGKLAELDAVIVQFPSSSLTPSAYLEKAQTYIALDNASDAITNYRTVIERFPATAQGRNAMLQLAITYRNNGDSQLAIDTYRQVVAKYPSSDEASVAVDDLKSIYAEMGRLDELDRFLSSVAGAPQLDVVEKNALASRALFRKATEAMERNDQSTVLTNVTEIMKNYPDTEVAEDALAMKADVEYSQGKTEMALDDYWTLNERASNPTMIQRARMGIARTARDLGRDTLVVKVTNLIMSSSAAGYADEQEVKYLRACSLDKLGDRDEAEAIWSGMAEDYDNLYGSMSAVALADSYYRHGEFEKAKKAVNWFIDTNGPHKYWNARAFILLSDILRALGATYEADEYVRLLRKNYPGDEPDIFDMIDTRMAKYNIPQNR